MMFDKEMEFDLRVLKGLIKIAKELYRNKKDPLEFFEELRKEGDVDTAFAFGVATSVRAPWFAERVYHNLMVIIQKLEENKSEEEILEEFEKTLKEEKLEEFMMYGG